MQIGDRFSAPAVSGESVKEARSLNVRLADAARLQAPMSTPTVLPGAGEACTLSVCTQGNASRLPLFDPLAGPSSDSDVPDRFASTQDDDQTALRIEMQAAAVGGAWFPLPPPPPDAEVGQQRTDAALVDGTPTGPVTGVAGRGGKRSVVGEDELSCSDRVVPNAVAGAFMLLNAVPSTKQSITLRDTALNDVEMSDRARAPDLAAERVPLPAPNSTTTVRSSTATTSPDASTSASTAALHPIESRSTPAERTIAGDVSSRAQGETVTSLRRTRPTQAMAYADGATVDPGSAAERERAEPSWDRAVAQDMPVASVDDTLHHRLHAMPSPEVVRDLSTTPPPHFHLPPKPTAQGAHPLLEGAIPIPTGHDAHATRFNVPFQSWPSQSRVELSLAGSDPATPSIRMLPSTDGVRQALEQAWPTASVAWALDARDDGMPDRRHSRSPERDDDDEENA